MEVILLFLENLVFMIPQTALEDLLVLTASVLVITIIMLSMDIVVPFLLQMPTSNSFHLLASDSDRIRRNRNNVLPDVILSSANFLHVSVLQTVEESPEDFVGKKPPNSSY